MKRLPNYKLALTIIGLCSALALSSCVLSESSPGTGEWKMTPKVYEDFWNEETQAEKDVRMEWWREARFGMFIHWGLYAIPAGEWDGKTNYAEWIRRRAEIPHETYNQFVDQFNPVEFDADAWARMAKEAGMKYMVITSKHHDGFCLFPSDYTEFDIASTPFKRDILRELTKACKRHGIEMCFYYSIMDWNHPGWPAMDWETNPPPGESNMEEYTVFMKHQLCELIKRYDPGVIWFDGEWEEPWTHEAGKDLYQYVRELKPDIIINNRVDKGRRGMKGFTKEGEFRGDFGTPEQQIPDQGIPGVDWESCMTMNRHWGWNKSDDKWKSTEDLVHKLIDIASKGGNFLLNIGPKADGTFPQESIERLAGIGEWMQVNGEAIYGTSASPYPAPDWGRFTQKDGVLYAHILNWPESAKLLIADPELKARSAYPLRNHKQMMKINKVDGGWGISLSAVARDPIATVIAIVTE